jgi:hypothetical protein
MAEQLENPLENILVAQITALENNITRMITLLINQEALYPKDIALSGKFKKLVNQKNQRLGQIKSVIQRADVTPAQMEYGWVTFHQIKNEVQRVFTQCLDYIGGIAVRKWGLEEQICKMAETLVEDHLKQGANWGSVAIMGEDRLPDSVAHITQIIRLPFPEWDLWSLPFTAYEFGRWIVDEKWVEGLAELLKDEPKRIQQLIQVTNVEELIETGVLDKSDILDGEIQDLEVDINELRRSRLDGVDISETLKKKLEQLEASLKEFFADAFATYFLGPAYGYARVCLRLNPMTASDPRSLEAQRMGIVLGVLKKMNDSAKMDRLGSGPYEPEIRLLKELWEKTIKMTHPDFNAKFEYGKPYNAWAEVLYTTLDGTYSKDGFSLQTWKAAVDLGQRFIENNESTEATSLPIILNAAWYGRVRKPNEFPSIERKARKQIEASLKRSADAGTSLASDARSAESSAPVR